MKKITVFLSLILFFLLAYLSIPSAYAQQITLSIDPSIVQTKIKPGKSILIAYTSQNKGDPVAVQFAIYSFSASGNRGGVQLAPLEGPIEFVMENTDISLGKPFFFNSNERKQALLRISVPPTAPEGDYYFMVVAETVPTDPAEGKTASLASAQLGAPLLVTVTESGLSEVRARISQFSIRGAHDFTFGKNSYHLIDSSQPLDVILAIENMGRNVIQPDGSIQVRHGATIKSYSLLGQNILKTSERIIKTNPTTTSSTDTSVTVSGLGWGKNTISAEVRYIGNSEVQFARVDVYAIPFRFGIVFVIALAASGLIVLSQRKKSRPDKDAL